MSRSKTPTTDIYTPPVFASMQAMVDRVESMLVEATDVYNTEVQAIADKHGVQIATGHMSDFWQVKTPRASNWKHECRDEHPALKDLKALDTIAIEIRIGPANMMMFHPAKKARVKV